MLIILVLNLQKESVLFSELLAVEICFCVFEISAKIYKTNLSQDINKRLIFTHVTTLHLRVINPLTPNDPYNARTASLTSKVAFYIFIQQIYLLNILNMVYTLRSFSLQNAVCFIILTYLVPVLFTFYIQGVLKLKKIPASKV